MKTKYDLWEEAKARHPHAIVFVTYSDDDDDEALACTFGESIDECEIATVRNGLTPGSSGYDESGFPMFVIPADRQFTLLRFHLERAGYRSAIVSASELPAPLTPMPPALAAAGRVAATRTQSSLF